MDSNEKLKEVVKEKYARIAIDADNDASSSSCCAPAAASNTGTSCCCGSPSDINYTVLSDEYQHLQGYVAEADLNLGCGLPTEYAGIRAGDTVVDLGSGAGNDVFIARSITGDSGRVIGIDMTPEMIAKAEKNNAKLGFTNVEFRLGEIEDMPIEDNTADVVVSNCVLNLVPDKKKAFSEMYRIIKPGGHFCVSDIVLKGELPEALQRSAEMYAGCVSGAQQQEDYIGGIEKAGFKNVEIKKTKTIELPLETLVRFMDEEDAKAFMQSGKGIFSITVVGYK